MGEVKQVKERKGNKKQKSVTRTTNISMQRTVCKWNKTKTKQKPAEPSSSLQKRKSKAELCLANWLILLGKEKKLLT